MSFTRLATLVTFTGTIALTYICSAEPQMELTAAPTSVTKESATVSAAPISAPIAVSRGNVKLGGSLSYSGNKDFGSFVTVAPSAQYFLVDRVAIGLGVDIGMQDWNVMYRSLRPSLSYYFYASENLAAFVKQDFGYNLSRYRFNDEMTDYAYVDSASSIGLDWFVNRNVAITPILGANYGGGRLAPTISANVALTVYL